MKGKRTVDMSENRRPYSDDISLKAKNLRFFEWEKVTKIFGKGKNWKQREIC